MILQLFKILTVEKSVELGHVTLFDWKKFSTKKIFSENFFQLNVIYPIADQKQPVLTPPTKDTELLVGIVPRLHRQPEAKNTHPARKIYKLS